MSCKICEKMLHTLFKAESSSDSLVFANSTYQRLSAFFFPAALSTAELIWTRVPADIDISKKLLEIEKEATEPAGFLGYLHDEGDSYVPDKVYFGSKDGKTAVLNAHRVEMVERILGKPYTAKMGDSQSVVAFYKNGKIAATIAPVSDEGGIDHSTARDTLKRHETAKPRRYAPGRPRARARDLSRKAPTGKTGRRGRPLRRPEGFYEQAGALWREARDASPNRRVSDTQLREIARALDERGYLPPWKYLEGIFSDALKEYNRRHSPSSIKTWVQLVECKHAVHFPGKRGMRRLLSRFANSSKPFQLPLFIGL